MLGRLSLIAIGLATACVGPFVTLEEGSESDAETELPSETETEGNSTPPTSTTSTSTSTSTATVTVTSADETAAQTTGDEVAYCAQTCTIPADCAQGGDPADWACTDGYCEYIGELLTCDENSCPSAAGVACIFIDGIEQCAFVCTELGGECEQFGFSCTGVADDLSRYCEPPPCSGLGQEGEPCEIEGFGQIGVCTDGLCTCTDDSQCTAFGYGCND